MENTEKQQITEEEARQLILNYKRDTGKSQSQIAQEMGISGAKLSGFLNGSYAAPHTVIPQVQALMSVSKQKSIAPREPSFVETRVSKAVMNMKVETVHRKVLDEKSEKNSVYGSQEEMQEKAKKGYFVRDPERNLVYCPAGEILRQKCIKKNGNIRYANKNACKHCLNRNKCYKGKGEWKEIDFTKDQLQKPCKDWLKAEGNEPEETKPKEKWHYEKKKVVKFFLKPEKEKTNQRMCLSEHPFGTIKRAMGATYFLLKGIRKVAGEFALFCLGYNLERAKNLLGFQKIMELMEQA